MADYRRLPSTPRYLWPVVLTEGMLPLHAAELLYNLAREVRDGVIVEVGSYRGRSTVALGRGARAGGRAPVFAVEPHESFTGVRGGIFGPEDRAAFYRTMLRTRCYRDVRLVNLTSDALTPGWRAPVALLWLDGDHATDAVRRDLAQWWPHLVPGATVVFDDCFTTAEGPGAVVAGEVAAGRLEITAQSGRVTATRVAADGMAPTTTPGDSHGRS
jgi:predicted O-methyltransferase YrrM